MYDEDTVKSLLETAIDSLIDNFIKEPYLHRVEHSMHCELHGMLSVHRSLQGTPLLQGSNPQRRTGLIHKEWPETKARPESQGRRGNFDLAILSPTSIEGSSVDEFTRGMIRPNFVIEMGLNYGQQHLENDERKITNSGHESNGYLVHLWQPHKGITPASLGELQHWCSQTTCKVAAAVFVGNNRVFLKHLDESTLACI